MNARKINLNGRKLFMNDRNYSKKLVFKQYKSLRSNKQLNLKMYSKSLLTLAIFANEIAALNLDNEIMSNLAQIN